MYIVIYCDLLPQSTENIQIVLLWYSSDAIKHSAELQGEKVKGDAQRCSLRKNSWWSRTELLSSAIYCHG